MTVAWHIAAKDIRRMAVPVALWLAFVAATTGWFQTGVGIGDHAVGAMSGWIGLMSIWVPMILFAQGLFSHVLAGAMVLEDSPVGTERFWLTRPTGKSGMLRGKLLAAALLFIVAPIVVLLPFWVANGFGGGELRRAIVTLALWQATSTACALGLSSMARTLAEFLLWSVALFVAYSLCWFVMTLSLSVHDVPAAVRRSRHLLVDTGIAVLLVGVLIAQYRRRDRRRNGLILAAGWLVAIAIAALWPADVSRFLGAARSMSTARPVDAATPIAVAAEPMATGERPGLVVTAGWQRDGFYAAALARSTDGRITFGPTPEWGHAAGLRALGFDRGHDAIAWPLTGLPGQLPGSMSPSRFSGTVEIWRARAMVVGEMPLEAGAELRRAGGRTRLIGLQREANRIEAIVIEEHVQGTSPVARAVVAIEGGELAAGQTYVDRYFLVDRGSSRALALPIDEAGALSMNGLLVRHRRLLVRGERWERALLVKVRIERERSFEQPVPARGLALARGKDRR